MTGATRCLVPMLLLLACGVAHGAPTVEASPLEILGFSDDGRYVAFTSANTQAESDVGRSTLMLVDVADNVIVGKPWIAATDWSRAIDWTGAARELRESARGQLEKHGIVSANAGVVVFDRPYAIGDRADFLFAGNVDYTRRRTGPSSVDTDDFRITLSTKPLTSDRCRGSDSTTVGVLVTLTNRSDHGRIVLQDDLRLPTSRGCPMAYRIRRVVTLRDHIVVFLTFLTSGFEGVPDVHHLAVTGRIR